MFKKYSEKRFNKRFPNLKQVVNEMEIDFGSNQGVPLRMGQNSIYLKDTDGTKTIYTEFNVDTNHNYSLRIEYYYPYLVNKIKVPFILMIIASLALQVMINVLFIDYFPYTPIVSLLASLVFYYLAVEYMVGKLGISIYRVVVLETKK